MKHIMIVCGIFLLSGGLLFTALTPHNACAAALFADDSCDPDYYESLRSRAWNEAQREVTQNQNLIFKPDSVLEYTCFDRHIRHMVQTTTDTPLFTADPRWTGAFTGTLDMAAALTPIALTNKAYNDSNFAQSYLGGRGTGSYVPDGAPVLPGNYTCDVMARVWEQAKCMNFIQNPVNDGFFTFPEYWSSADKRFAPSGCPNIVQTDILNNYSDAVIDASTPWSEDRTTTYFTEIYPTSPGCGTSRSTINTGLKISRAEETPYNYDERICLVPGCYYNPSSNTCEYGTKP